MCPKTFIILALACGYFTSACKFGDNNCLKDDINIALASLAKDGIEGIDLQPLDPLKVKRTDLIFPPTEGNYMNLFLTEQNIIGLSKATIQNVSGFGEELSGPHSITLLVPSYKYVGNYEVDLNLKGIEAKGTGKNEVGFLDVVMKITFTGKPHEKNGKIHLLIDKVDTEFQPKGVQVNFEGLPDETNMKFNQFGIQLIAIVNESLTTATSKTFKSVFQRVFDVVPYNNFFI